MAQEPLLPRTAADEPASSPSVTGQPATAPIDGRISDAFPNIADYAFLSDCENNCLIAPSGAVEWFCIPRPDSPSVFSSLLDRTGGFFKLGPYGVQVPAARRYLPGTLVLETTWQTSTGWIIVRDALVMGPWHNVDERSRTHHRSPTDIDADHCLVRVVTCLHGSVDIGMHCEPLFDYARIGPTWEYIGDGYTKMRASAEGQPTIVLTSSLRMGKEGRTAQARTTMRPGDEHFVALSFSELPGPQTAAEANEHLQRTSEYWREWLTQGCFPDHPWRTYLQSSALALKGLSYAPTGALLAAATMSLPETPGGERNWDYRYSWIRDSTFALWGLYTLGFDREANDFFFFINDVCRDNNNDLQIMYGVGGERTLPEETLDHLSGYADSRPVRVGNGAFDQQQHDVWGALLDSIYLHARTRERMPDELWPVVKAQVEQAASHWRAPDRGIWEVRGDPQHFTSSKIMCWVALDRGARLARLHDSPGTAEKWQTIADEIHDDICANGVDARGVFVQRYGSEALDASLLLAPLVRFLPADDPRIRDTVLAIADELTDNGLVMRYRVRGDRRRAGRRRGNLYDLFVLVGLGTGRDRRGGPGAPAVRPVAVPRLTAGALRGGAGRDHRPAPGQLPAGLHPPRADQRGHPRHPGAGRAPGHRVQPGEPAGLIRLHLSVGPPPPPRRRDRGTWRSRCRRRRRR